MMFFHTVPSKPESIKAVVAGPKSVIVAWGAPKRPRGPITKYNVHWTVAGGSMPGKHQIYSKLIDADTKHIKLYNLPSAPIEVRVIEILLLCYFQKYEKTFENM